MWYLQTIRQFFLLATSLFQWDVGSSAFRFGTAIRASMWYLQTIRQFFSTCNQPVSMGCRELSVPLRYRHPGFNLVIAECKFKQKV